MRPDGPRDEFAGLASGPEPPFPIKLSGPVIRGFGRGGKELGIPTANIPPSGLSAYPDLQSGIYFGYTSLYPAPASASSNGSNGSSTDSNDTNGHSSTSNSVEIYPCVLSLGYNPFYKNTTRSIEIHILRTFSSDFYTHSLNLLILGFIRPEYDYVNLDSLVEDINFDCGVARRSLLRPGWELDSQNAVKGAWKEYLEDFTWASKLTGEDVKRVEKEVLGGTEQKAK